MLRRLEFFCCSGYIPALNPAQKVTILVVPGFAYIFQAKNVTGLISLHLLCQRFAFFTH